MARPRAADYDNKRNRLLEVSARLFAQFGFDRTSISEIASEAGVSKALLYHYYKSKDEVLFDIIYNHLINLLDQIKAADAADSPPYDHLESLIKAILFAYRDADTMHKVQINELDKLSSEKQKSIRGLEREIVAIIARAIVRLNPDLPRNGTRGLIKPVTMSLFGIVNWSYLWFADGGSLSRAAYAKLVTSLFVQGVDRLKAADFE